jgi:hypothetical protein
MVRKGGAKAAQVLKTYVRPEELKLRKGPWAGDKPYHTIADTAEVLHGTPVKPNQLPETLYHVSPRLDDIRSSGALRHMAEASGGLGKGTSKAHQGVSFTTDRTTALNIKREIIRNNEVAVGKVHEDVRSTLLRYAAEDEKLAGLSAGTLKQTAENIATRYEAARSLGGQSAEKLVDTWKGRAWDAVNEYRMARERLGGPENPIFFGGWKDFVKATPENVGIVAVNPKQIPTEALIRQDPIGGGHLSEVMVHADVPVHESKFVTQPKQATARPREVIAERKHPRMQEKHKYRTAVQPFEQQQVIQGGVMKNPPQRLTTKARPSKQVETLEKARKAGVVDKQLKEKGYYEP